VDNTHTTKSFLGIKKQDGMKLLSKLPNNPTAPTGTPKLAQGSICQFLGAGPFSTPQEGCLSNPERFFVDFSHWVHFSQKYYPHMAGQRAPLNYKKKQAYAGYAHMFGSYQSYNGPHANLTISTCKFHAKKNPGCI